MAEGFATESVLGSSGAASKEVCTKVPMEGVWAVLLLLKFW